MLSRKHLMPALRRKRFLVRESRLLYLEMTVLPKNTLPSQK